MGSAFISENDISIIVTRNFIEKLGCSKEPSFIFRKTRDGRAIPIPIRAIVDKLPGDKIDFLATQYFYSNQNSLGDKFLFDDNKKLYAYAVVDSSKIEEFRKASEDFFARYWDEGGMLEVNTIDVYPYQFSYKSVIYLQVSFNFEDIMIDNDDLPIPGIGRDKEIQLTRNIEEMILPSHYSEPGTYFTAIYIAVISTTKQSG